MALARRRALDSRRESPSPEDISRRPHNRHQHNQHRRGQMNSTPFLLNPNNPFNYNRLGRFPGPPERRRPAAREHGYSLDLFDPPIEELRDLAFRHRSGLGARARMPNMLGRLPPLVDHPFDERPYGRQFQDQPPEHWGFPPGYGPLSMTLPTGLHPIRGRSPRGQLCSDENCPHCIYEEEDCNNERLYPFKTKSIKIRERVYRVRSSYLAESTKFEEEIVKYMDKKTQSQISDRIVWALIEYINREQIGLTDISELISLNILASTLGVKSATAASLTLLKDWNLETEVGMTILQNLIVTIMLSSKVDDGLRQWLKAYLKCNDRYDAFVTSRLWERMIDDHPEVKNKIMKLMGQREEEDEEAYRIL